jgi:glucuronate isomerase
MKHFIHKDFLLQSNAARKLYHERAAALPIIDYHCHLSPIEIAQDRRFDDLSQIWLESDHYKWRLMRTCGVPERYITGADTSGWEKFEKWAAVVPQCMGNPMYHWVHLELKTAFGVDILLNPRTARDIYDHCTRMLQKAEFSAKNLMLKYNVEAVCTTDDPADSLHWHGMVQASGFKVKVLPTFRPDRAANPSGVEDYHKYLDKLSKESGVNILGYDDLIFALQKRHDAFDRMGCRLSDHGLSDFAYIKTTENKAKAAFSKYIKGSMVSIRAMNKLKLGIMEEFARMDYESQWTQQIHYGALRNVNSRLYNKLGADAGGDCIGDWACADGIANFLSHLERASMLPQTIMYNLNPKDNAMLCAMMGSFQNGNKAGKMQWGAAWWFMDNLYGMEEHMRTLSSLGCLSQFVGMLTDSRSFLSYPRHEYFRRILCNFLGNQIEQGLLPSWEIDHIGTMVENICYYNAKQYFNF